MEEKTAGREITQEEREELTGRYRNKILSHTAELNKTGTPTGMEMMHVLVETGTEVNPPEEPTVEFQAIKGFTFDADLVADALYAAPGGKLHIELGLKEEGTITPVLTVLSAEKVVVASYEYSFPCPPVCPFE